MEISQGTSMNLKMRQIMCMVIFLAFDSSVFINTNLSPRTSNSVMIQKQADLFHFCLKLKQIVKDKHKHTE